VGLAPGEVLFAEGDPADDFAIVDAGAIRAYHLTAGGRSVTLERVGPGDSIGLGPALVGGRHDTMAEAVEASAVVLVPAEALRATTAGDPAVAAAALTEVERRSERLVDVVRALAADVPSRLASYLFGRALAVGEASPNGLVVDLGMTKTELASTLATVPETLSRAFARLCAEGLIELDGSTVTVLDVGGLVRRGAGYEEA
jgi:CRP/FNR family transcriptional regulator